MKKILSELRRRNVFKMAVLFAIGAWMVLSVADLLFGIIDAPEGSLRIVFIVLAIGFPIALFLSWFFEITPEGLKLESEITPDESITADTGRKMNFMIAFGVLLVIAGMAIQYFIFSDTGGLEAIAQESIAVMPFVDMSPAGDQEYFGDGIAEELLNLLSQIPDLKVAARTSAFSFKGKEADVATIGEQLNVAHVLEGSIRKAGDKIRITAQLIAVKDGYHLFSETYDRAMVDIFAVQDEIAAAVVEKLRIALLDENPLAARRTNPHAFNLYLEARRYSRMRTKEGFEQALDLLESAIDIDPQFAPAWAEIGHVYLTKAFYGERSFYEPARENFLKAIEIDADLAEPWADLSGIALIFEWDYTRSEELLVKALSIDGRNSLVIRRAGIFAFHSGEPERALAYHTDALSYDPLNLTLLLNAGLVNYRLGHYEEALRNFDKAQTLSPDYRYRHYYRANVIREMGDPRLALVELEKESNDYRRGVGRAMAYYDLGQLEDLENTIQELEELVRSMGNEGYLAEALAYTGQVDKAFEYLDLMYAKRRPWLQNLSSNRHFLNLHADPRWADLMQRIEDLKK